MLIRRHDKSFIVELEDRSTWRIWPSDLATTLEPYDETNLRHSVLMMRLRDILDKLIINPTMQEHPGGEVDQLRHTIGWAILNVIRASHLDTFDPALSIQHKSDDKIRRQKEGAQDFTSLSLFRDDVELLLRDLYGDLNIKALDRVLSAIFYIVRQLTRYVRADLWKEQIDAEDFDYMFGVGVPEGYSISGSEWRRGMEAKSNLILRACEVNANPLAFAEYTVKFGNWFAQNWDCSVETAFDRDSSQ
jgi:hypothetical protein